MEGFFEHEPGHFFQVPNRVEDLPEAVLGVHAFRVLCHVARTKPGTFFDVHKLCERFCIAYDGKVWRRVSKQLRAIGALSDVEERSEGGKVIRKRLRFRWPSAEDIAAPIRAKGTDGFLGCEDTPPIRAKGTERSVQKERIILRLKTPTRRVAAVAAKRRDASGNADAFAKPKAVDRGKPKGVEVDKPSAFVIEDEPKARERRPVPEVRAYLHANGVSWGRAGG